MSLDRFIKVYSYLPLEERKLTIVIIDDEPISWKRAYEEIRNNTPLGARILKKLVNKGLI